jgi:hypothetical protein
MDANIVFGQQVLHAKQVLLHLHQALHKQQWRQQC